MESIDREAIILRNLCYINTAKPDIPEAGKFDLTAAVLNEDGDKLIMGYKGKSVMDSGYFYAPYIPVTKTPVVLDADSFCPRKGILTKYGKKLLREGDKLPEVGKFPLSEENPFPEVELEIESQIVLASKVELKTQWTYECKDDTTSQDNVSSKGILARYGKKLLEQGQKFYKKLSVKDFCDE